MVRDTWSWIVPDGLWEIAKPLIPPPSLRPQGGGVQDTPDETLFAAIVYVLVSGCAWRAPPPCFGVSKSTAHRRLLDVTRAVLDAAHVRAKKAADSQARAPWTGVNRVPGCTSCRKPTDCRWSSASPPVLEIALHALAYPDHLKHDRLAFMAPPRLTLEIKRYPRNVYKSP
ncbi:hypothetical protein GCM10010433_68250 [Streptomyces pulveraceus]